MVIRYVKSDIKAPEELGLPEVLKDLVMKKEGLFLFVGSTGAGKSTSMASLIQYRNQRDAGHILTIEDPIEFTYRHDKSIIGQREVGFDTHSYENAMREAMREAPDVIMVGEIRSPATVEAAMGFADTGHLVISTLHATSAVQALERITYLLPSDQKERVLMDLSLNLNAIIELFKAGRITRENALENASSKNNLEWMLSFDTNAEGATEGKSVNSKPELAGVLPTID